MAEQYYTRPELPGGIKPVMLVPEHGLGNLLTDATPVVIINRGREVYRDKFDGKDYAIPPGYSELEFAPAQHFRNRAVVPGSRNPETGRQQSFIGIVGLDRPERCEPFSDRQCEQFGLRIEAIAREELTSPEARDVRVVDTSRVQARLVDGQPLHLPTTVDTRSGADRAVANELLTPAETGADQAGDDEAVVPVQRPPFRRGR